MPSLPSLTKIQNKSDTEKTLFLYKRCLNIDQLWNEAENRRRELVNLKQCFEELGTHLPRLDKLLPLISENMTQHQLEHLIVPLERELGKEHSKYEISQIDGQNQNTREFPLVVVLDSLRSAFNVGSIFRTSDSLGVSKLFLCGYTPTPEQSKTLKTTMGADKNIAWQTETSTSEVIHQLKDQGFTIYALETSPQATGLFNAKLQSPAALVLGNERFGLSAKLLAQVDEVLSIPQFGFKNSMNVSVAFGVCGYEFIRQWETQNEH